MKLKARDKEKDRKWHREYARKFLFNAIHVHHYLVNLRKSHNG